MTPEQLSSLLGWSQVAFLIALIVGAIVLLAGMVRPATVGAHSRGGVLLRSLGVWLFGAAILLGAIGFTHSQPNGPHSVTGYIESYVKDECAKGADLPSCKDAKTKPAD